MYCCSILHYVVILGVQGGKELELSHNFDIYVTIYHFMLQIRKYNAFDCNNMSTENIIEMISVSNFFILCLAYKWR